MSSLSPVSEALTVFVHAFTAAAAVAGAIAAWSGLTTWKKQSLWKQDNDLAKQLLLRLRQKSDAFHSLRSPFVSAGEMRNALKEAGTSYSEEQGWAAAIDMRFKRLIEANAEIYPLIIEASTVWDEGIESEFQKFAEVEIRVRVAIEDVHRQNSSKSRIRDEDITTRKAAFSSSEDEIAREYEAIAERLKLKFKQKLDRKR